MSFFKLSEKEREDLKSLGKYLATNKKGKKKSKSKKVENSLRKAYFGDSK